MQESNDDLKATDTFIDLLGDDLYDRKKVEELRPFVRELEDIGKRLKEAHTRTSITLRNQIKARLQEKTEELIGDIVLLDDKKDTFARKTADEGSNDDSTTALVDFFPDWLRDALRREVGASIDNVHGITRERLAKIFEFVECGSVPADLMTEKPSMYKEIQRYFRRHGMDDKASFIAMCQRTDMRRHLRMMEIVLGRKLAPKEVTPPLLVEMADRLF